jgi:glycosyltransferase involved in cell wall biosynthesis
MRKINVLHITQASGGVKTYLHSFVKEINKDWFTNILLTSENEDVKNGADKIFDSVLTLPMVRNLNLIHDIRGIFLIKKIIQQNNYDIVHIHSSKAGLIGRIGSKLGGAKNIIYTPHGFSYLSYSGVVRLMALTWERIARRYFTTYFLATSASEWDRGIREVGFNASNSIMVNNGIDVKRVNSIEKKDTDNLLILSMARYHPVKNPMMLIRAAHYVLVKNSKCKFLLIGGGYHDTLHQTMRNYIEENNLTNHITLMNWVDRSEAILYLNTADIYVSSSRTESFGYSVVEAMSNGLPIVGTKIDGTKDIVINGLTGFIVNIDDHVSMAEKIMYLLENPDIRKTMGDAGRIRASELFDVKNNVRYLEEYYRSLMR